MPLPPASLRAYPHIHIELELVGRLVNLQQEDFDLAICHTDMPPETHVAWELARTRSWLVASPQHLKEHGEPRVPTDLASHERRQYPRRGDVQRWSFEHQVARKPPEREDVAVGGSLKTNNSEILREAVLADVGVGLLPDFSCAEWIKTGQLVPLLELWKPVGFFGERIYAIRPFQGCKTPKSVECLVQARKAGLSAQWARRSAPRLPREAVPSGKR